MFHLQSNLDYLYDNSPRRLAFNASTLAEFDAWKHAYRTELAQILGLSGRTVPANPKAEKLQAIDRGQYIEEKYALDVGQNVPAPMFVLVPKTEPPYKIMMVFMGHNPSVQYILGNYPDEQTAQEKRALDNNYAQALAEAGYLVCTVEQRGFGERVSDQMTEPANENACRHLAFEYMMQGRNLLGERIWDGMVAISYMRNREDVVPDVVGCTGNSGGGTTTIWLSALDDRVTVCVPACYFCSFKASILGMRHCECNYVPGSLALGEMGDLTALIAPRPFRAIAGEHDPIYPVEAAREQFETVKRAYALHGAEDRCSLAVHPGEHAYNHAMSHEWFGQWL